MEPTDLTVEILKDIRQEIRDVRLELRETKTELREEIHELRLDLSGRIDETNRRLVDSEIRTSTAITALAGSVQEMTQVPRATHDLRPRVERCERDIAELKRGA